MDVPIKHDIEIHYGLKGNQKPSTFSLNTDVDNLYTSYNQIVQYFFM